MQETRYWNQLEFVLPSAPLHSLLNHLKTLLIFQFPLRPLYILHKPSWFLTIHLESPHTLVLEDIVDFLQAAVTRLLKK